MLNYLRLVFESFSLPHQGFAAPLNLPILDDELPEQVIVTFALIR
jgi:hypothetical protein